MRVLVSVCNKRCREEFQFPDTFLFDVDTERGDIRPVKLEHPRSKAAVGVNGLAHYGGGILLVPQNAQQLVHLDSNLSVSQIWDVPEVTGGHSIAVRGSKAHIVCARTDSILEFDPGNESRWFWRANAGEADTMHMNSALWVDDALYLSAFGPKPEKHALWSTASNGYLLNVTSYRPIIQPIYHPHSLTHFDGQLYWCESAKMAICNQWGQRLEVGRGYVRGLVVNADHVVVGVSKGRNMSISTDRPIADSPFQETECAILVYRLDREDFGKSPLLTEIPFQAYGDEIYDILPLDSTNAGHPPKEEIRQPATQDCTQTGLQLNSPPLLTSNSGGPAIQTPATTVPDENPTQRPRYTVLLEKMHDVLEPRLYLEIGVRHGRSLRLARGPAIGVDPEACVDPPLPDSATVFCGTSDEFFHSGADIAIQAPLDMAFIDGMHLFEYALRDFMNIERIAEPTAAIVFDDIFPHIPTHAERVRQSGVWMGDVWKIMPILREYRPELTCLPVDVATGGLLIVAGLDPTSNILWNNYTEIVERYSSPPFLEVSANVLTRSGAATADDPRIADLLLSLRALRDQRANSEHVRSTLRKLPSHEGGNTSEEAIGPTG